MAKRTSKRSAEPRDQNGSDDWIHQEILGNDEMSEETQRLTRQALIEDGVIEPDKE